MKIRYVELPPPRVFNWLSPENVTCRGAMAQWHDTWWEPETVEKRRQFANYWREKFDQITNHFSNLKDSIIKDGVQRPISTVSGIPRGTKMKDVAKGVEHVPPEMRDGVDQLISTKVFGGSRLTIAVELGLEKIPCIVYDFSNLFPMEPEVTQSNFRNWFGNEYTVSVYHSLPLIRIFNHSHISSGPYRQFTNSSRNAQQKATEYAKGKF